MCSMKLNFTKAINGRLFLLVLVFFVQDGFSQASRFLYRNYTRWTVEAYAGVPFMAGNLTAFSADRTYIKPMYGIRAGFQANRIFGIGLSVSRGQNRLGSRDYAADFLLCTDGNTYYFPPETLPTYAYKDIYSDITFMNAGVFTDINLTNVAGFNSCISVLFSPGIYIQQNEATVKRKADHLQLLPVRSGMSIGLGADLGIRFRTGKWIDLQLKTGVMWLSDNDFIGFSTPIQARYNYVWNTSVGVIFKIPGKGKRDNLIYLPREGACYWKTNSF